MSFVSHRVRAKIQRAVTVAPLIAVVALSASPLRLLAASRTTGVGFQGLQSTVAIGFGIPHAAALDAAGNLYVADLINSTVVRIPRGASSANCTVSGSCFRIGSGFIQPNGIAVDAAGNVFVVDGSTLNLYKITPSGTQTVVASNLPGAFGLALASDGTAYIAASGSILRVSPSGITSSFASGPSQPGGLAVSPTGIVYLVDVSGNRVLAYSPAGTPATLASGFAIPESVALDDAGNLYVTDSGNQRIWSLSATGTGFVCPADCSALALQVNTPYGIASDSGGNIYVSDTGTNQVVKLTQDADFGSSPILASNANPATSLTLNYLLYGSSCASPPTVSVLTRGAANKDFTSSPSATVCTPGTPDALAITVNFAPLSPGLRAGSVQFLDTSGIPQIGTYLHGVGKGPLITWTPGVVTAAMTSPSQ